MCHRKLSVHILCAAQRPCLCSWVPACDSLTIILEEIPRVACQSQLTANPGWVERSSLHINHGIWLWASHWQADWTATNRLSLYVVRDFSNTKADCSNQCLWYWHGKMAFIVSARCQVSHKIFPDCQFQYKNHHKWRLKIHLRLTVTVRQKTPFMTWVEIEELQLEHAAGKNNFLLEAPDKGG